MKYIKTIKYSIVIIAVLAYWYNWWPYRGHGGDIFH